MKPENHNKGLFYHPSPRQLRGGTLIDDSGVNYGKDTSTKNLKASSDFAEQYKSALSDVDMEMPTLKSGSKKDRDLYRNQMAIYNKKVKDKEKGFKQQYKDEIMGNLDEQFLQAGYTKDKSGKWRKPASISSVPFLDKAIGWIPGATDFANRAISAGEKVYNKPNLENIMNAGQTLADSAMAGYNMGKQLADPKKLLKDIAIQQGKKLVGMGLPKDYNKIHNHYNSWKMKGKGTEGAPNQRNKINVIEKEPKQESDNLYTLRGFWEDDKNFIIEDAINLSYEDKMKILEKERETLEINNTMDDELKLLTIKEKIDKLKAEEEEEEEAARIAALAAKKAVLKKTVPKKAVPKKTVPKKAVPKKTAEKTKKFTVEEHEAGLKAYNAKPTTVKEITDEELIKEANERGITIIKPIRKEDDFDKINRKEKGEELTLTEYKELVAGEKIIIVEPYDLKELKPNSLFTHPESTIFEREEINNFNKSATAKSQDLIMLGSDVHEDKKMPAVDGYYIQNDDGTFTEIIQGKSNLFLVDAFKIKNLKNKQKEIIEFIEQKFYPKNYELINGKMYVRQPKDDKWAIEAKFTDDDYKKGSDGKLYLYDDLDGFVIQKGKITGNDYVGIRYTKDGDNYIPKYIYHKPSGKKIFILKNGNYIPAESKKYYVNTAYTNGDKIDKKQQLVNNIINIFCDMHEVKINGENLYEASIKGKYLLSSREPIRTNYDIYPLGKIGLAKFKKDLYKYMELYDFYIDGKINNASDYVIIPYKKVTTATVQKAKKPQQEPKPPKPKKTKEEKEAEKAEKELEALMANDNLIQEKTGKTKRKINNKIKVN
jgi:hypothetical protein